MAAAIRAERSAKEWSQEELAQKSGINYETLKRILKGERDINITQISGIAAAVGITPAALVKRAEDRLADLRAEAVSVAPDTHDELATKREAAKSMTTEQLENTEQRAATTDDELDADEPSTT